MQKTPSNSKCIGNILKLYASNRAPQYAAILDDETFLFYSFGYLFTHTHTQTHKNTYNVGKREEFSRKFRLSSRLKNIEQIKPNSTKPKHHRPITIWNKKYMDQTKSQNYYFWHLQRYKSAAHTNNKKSKQFTQNTQTHNLHPQTNLLIHNTKKK